MSDCVEPLSRKLLINNEFGLHLKPAAMIAKIAKQANARVWIIRGNEIADASDVMDILAIGCVKGSSLTVRIEDRSDMNILESISNLVEKGFEE